VRAYGWRVGAQMVREAPLLGVGYNNFGQLFLAYQLEVPGSPQIFDKPRSPHSSYVGIVAELGLIGAALWIVLLGVAFRNLLLAGRRTTADGAPARFFLVQAVGNVLLLQVLYGWALNSHMNKNFWFILGLSVVLHQLALKRAGSDPD
jgi:O-antigen ligase